MTHTQGIQQWPSSIHFTRLSFQDHEVVVVAAVEAAGVVVEVTHTRTHTHWMVHTPAAVKYI